MSKKKDLSARFDDVLGGPKHHQKPVTVHNSSETITRTTKRKGKPVTLYLNATNYYSLKEVARERELSVSSIIDQMIVDYLKGV